MLGRHPFDGVSDEAVVEELVRGHGLAVLPGSAFGALGDRAMRFSIANVDARQLPDVTERLRRLDRRQMSGVDAYTQCRLLWWSSAPAFKASALHTILRSAVIRP